MRRRVARQPGRRACRTGKIRYRDESSARRAVRSATNPRAPIRWYQCEHCKGWHLTSRPERNR